MGSKAMDAKKQRYKVHGTGNINKRSLSMKKREVYQLFIDFNLDFDEIIKFRGYPLNNNQIEMYLSDCINCGYSYNWKKINDAILKTSNYKIAIANNSFFVDFIFLQIKVIELVQKQMNEIFKKYPNAKQQLLFFYDNHGLNPFKLQKKIKKLKNDQNKKKKKKKFRVFLKKKKKKKKKK